MISKKRKETILKSLHKLPLHECLINSTWEDDRLAKIIISRKHPNNKISATYIEVDLAATGVLYSNTKLLLTDIDYKSIVSYWSSETFIKAEYNLLHNIINTAIKFARGMGLLAYHIYLEEDHHILEKDETKIEHIDIKVGDKNNKVHYIQTERHPTWVAIGVVQALNKNLGEGNFIYKINGIDLEERREKVEYLRDNKTAMLFANYQTLMMHSLSTLKEIYDPDEDYTKYYFDNFIYADTEGMRYDHMKEHVEDLIVDFEKDWDEFLEKKKDDTNDISWFLTRVEAIVEKLSNEKEVKRYLDLWRDDYFIDIFTAELVPQIVGERSNYKFKREDIKLLSKIFNKNTSIAQRYQLTKDRWGEIALADYWKLVEQKQTSESEYPKLLKKLLKKHPEFPLIKIANYEFELANDKVEANDLTIKNIFGGRTEMSLFEYLAYSMLRTNFIAKTFNTSAFTAIRKIYHKMMNVEYETKQVFNIYHSTIMANELKKRVPQINKELDEKFNKL